MIILKFVNLSIGRNQRLAIHLAQSAQTYDKKKGILIISR